MKEYKGIYYGDDSEKKFFEGGAHFKYIKLYKILEQIALEQKMKEKEKEKQKELYVHKRNKLSNLAQNKKINNNTNYLDNISKEKKSRNIQGYFNNNITNIFSTNNIKNKSYTNNAFAKYNQKKGHNDILMINKTNYNQTYILIKNINNKEKNNSYGKKQSFAIKNQKKMMLSRNKAPSISFKGRPNTILKEGIQKLLFLGKNNLISNSMEQRKNNKKDLFTTFNKRSFPNINNLNMENRHKKIITNDSYLEVNKKGGKTERNKNCEQGEKWNKSQNNFSGIKIKLNSTNSTNAKKPQNKIKKKNFIMNESKKIKESTKSNLANYIYRNIIEQLNYKKDKENEDKKESMLKKQDKKKNSNKKYILPNNTNLSTKAKMNINNQIKKIIYKPNIIKKIDEKIFIDMNKVSFNGKSRNKNLGINEINNSYYMKSNQNIKSRNNPNNLILNTSRSKNNDKFKTSYKIMIEKGKIPNMKQNSKILIYKNNNNRFTPKANKRVNKNSNINSNINSNNKKDNDIQYNLMINNIPLNKEKIIQNISKNNLSELRNKTLNINIINNTCIYIKPKQSQCGLKNKSRNEKIKTDIKPINFTQRPIIRKKKPLIKIPKK